LPQFEATPFTLVGDTHGSHPSRAATLSLLLASASPRRQALIGLLGIAWRAAAADVDEARFLIDDPLVAALNVAVAKARATAGDAGEVVVAADTLVVAPDGVLGKPADAAEARSMLGQLRGRSHRVVSGVALTASDGRAWGGVVSTRVVLRTFSDAEVGAYIARGEPFDKAGGYAIQDDLFRPVERVEGCFLNVVGLPVCAVAAGLNALGVPVSAAGMPPCDYCRSGAPLVTVG
jgi:MAF protein